MDAANRSLGRKPQIIVGVGPHAVLTGYCAYACVVRVDDTQIKSVTTIDSDSGVVGGVIINETWENIALISGIDYIPFEDRITSITLNGATDSLILYLEPYKVE